MSTREATEIMVIYIYSAYDNIYLEQVAANAVHMGADDIINLLILLNEFEVFFSVTIG